MTGAKASGRELALRQAGVEVLGEIQDEPYGRFAHARDPEGNELELWEPKEAAFEGDE